MNDENEWHNQDEFWELFEPWLFNEQRQSDAKAEVENVVKLLKIKPKDRILDLCCGIGRHSLELARRGFDVVGIDRTLAYIERARQAAEKNGLKVDFVVGDMREYCVSDGYDIVINLFGSFGYFEDEEDDCNIVARDWRSLAQFYEQVFGCIPVPPERDLVGQWLEAATGVPEARIRGIHLRCPGYGEEGPTLEVFQYNRQEEKQDTAINRPGIAHIAFAVEDVETARQAVLEAGGGEVGEVVTLEISGAGKITFVYLTDPEGNIIELQRWW